MSKKLVAFFSLALVAVVAVGCGKSNKPSDMGELGGLVAPRGLVVVNGKNDPIFPDNGVRRVYAEIERLYAAAGVPDRCRLVTGPGEHRFFADLAWPVMKELQK